MLIGVAGGVAAATAAGWLLVPAIANADEPFSIEERITDRVDALDDRRDKVEEVLDRLFEDHRLDLYLVYVDNFSGISREEWADTTAEQSRLGINDALLAVATGERVYQLTVDEEYPLTDGQLRDIQTVAIEPALRQNDWAGAAIGAANGLSAALSAQQVREPNIIPGDEAPSAEAEFPWVPVLLVGAGVAGVGGFAYARARRRDAHEGSYRPQIR
ncbi:MAG TPA: TPM domain-containing protein [Jiangellaceae bacterium]